MLYMTNTMIKFMKQSFFVICIIISCTTHLYAQRLNSSEVVQLSIFDLNPTQLSLGMKEVKYKVARYEANPQILFNDYCKYNGAGNVIKFSPDSTLKDLNSFECKLSYGSRLKHMKTAVRGPNNQYYLTDGHHLVSSLEEISGSNTPIFVNIISDKSYLQSDDLFNENMKNNDLAWLKDQNGQIFNFSYLPKKISIHSMKDDEYRSILYFLNGISFKKNEDTSLPFLEFYLAEWISKKIPLSTLKLDTPKDYYKSLHKVASEMVSTPPNEIITVINGQPISAQQFGIFTAVKAEELSKLIAPNGKINILFKSN